MFGSIFNGLSGLLGFSKALDVISNNIANMNTPGFKGSELHFRDLFYQYGLASQRDGNGAALQLGTGLDASSTSVLFRQGEMRETGNDSDVAIDGNGFFVLRQDGKTYYSRAGQFEFDEQGYLVDRASKARVAALAPSGGFRDINVNGLRTNAPKATSEIKFIDNLSSGATTHEVTGVTVYDSVGSAHTLKIKFTNNSSVVARSWIVEVIDSSDAVIASGQIRFQGNGSPEASYNTVSFNFSPDGAPTSAITLNFGAPGTFSGSTHFSGGTTSTLKMSSQDGYAVGSLTKVTFDADGYLSVTYSNGQTGKNERLALVWFDHPESLEQAGGSLFVNNSGQVARVGHAGEGVMGKLVAKSVEMSNVDLTQQFTDMVIVQRGYQGSSQIISVTNEMIQQLFDIRGKR